MVASTSRGRSSSWPAIVSAASWTTTCRRCVPGSPPWKVASPEAVGLSRAALAGYRDAGCRFDVALTILDMAALIGPAEPAVRSAIPEGREILESLGARPLVERLDALAWDAGRLAAGPSPASKSTAAHQ